MLLGTTDRRKAALDLRLHDPRLPDHPDSKVNRAVAEIERIWRETAADRSARLVSCDLSTPRSARPSRYMRICAKNSSSEAFPPPTSSSSKTTTAKRRSCNSSALCAPARCEFCSVARRRWARVPTCRSADCAASSRRSLATRRCQTARGPHPPPGQNQRRGPDLPLRHRSLIRRVHVAVPGIEGDVHRPGDDGRIGPPPHRRRGRRGAGVWRHSRDPSSHSRGIQRFTGWDVLAPKIVYAPVRVSAEERQAWLNNWAERLRAVESERPVEVEEY